MGYNPIPYDQDPAQWINSCINCIAFSSVAAKGNGADTTEDILQTFTLPANFLNWPTLQFNQATGQVIGLPIGVVNSIAGTGLRMKAWGVTANNADTKTLKLYHGALSFSFALNTNTAAAWIAEMIVMRASATTQIAMASVQHATTLIAPQQSTSGSDTLANSLVAKITGQASASNANDIVCNGAIVELIT